jgi:hypothetical protein
MSDVAISSLSWKDRPMRRTVAKVFMALLLFAALDAWPNDVFVSASGNDANP